MARPAAAWLAWLPAMLTALMLWTLPAGAAHAQTGLAGAARSQPIALTDDRGRRVLLPRPAQRIVSLLPSLTESVCALQACDRLVGVDRFSNWPAQVRMLPQLGGLEDTSIERVVALQPDLVLAAVSSRALARLESLGLPVLALEPRSLADAQRTLGVLGQALGRTALAAQLEQQTAQQLADAAARVPAALRGQTVYFEVGDGPWAAGEASFVGELLARLGLRNVVPAAMGPFPRLNPEFIVRAQPGIVMAPARELAAMADRPGWAGLRALQQGSSCGFSPAQGDLLVRPGPRLAEGAQVLLDCLQRLARRPASAPAP